MMVRPRRLVAMLVYGCALLTGFAAHAERLISPFGNAMIGSKNFSFDGGTVPEWNAMLERWANGAPCESETCTTKGWKEMVAQVRAAGAPILQIKSANQLINAITYVEDTANWDRPEYWATPYEFLKKSGDTEEYAIAKYFLLRAAGIPAWNMQILSVVTRSSEHISQALLSVQLEGRVLILDHRTPEVIDSSLLRDTFRARMGINEEAWWYYHPTKLQTSE